MIKWDTKKKGAERCFHHFILRLWKEIEDIEREEDMERVAHSQFCVKHTEHSQFFVLLKKKEHLVNNLKKHNQCRKETQIRSQPHRDDWQKHVVNKLTCTQVEKIVTERPLGGLC